MTFDESAARLVRKFDSLDVLTQLRENLYGQAQRSSETVEAFILKKHALFDRLAGPGHDSEFVRLVPTQIRPELRSRMRGRIFDYMDKFVEDSLPTGVGCSGGKKTNQTGDPSKTFGNRANSPSSNQQLLQTKPELA